MGLTNGEGARLAAEHLARARVALEREDEVAAVTWSYACAEIAIGQIAAARGLDSRNEHFRRATLARRLYELGGVPEDLADLMIRLNNERKHGMYEGRKPDLRGRTWEEVFAQLEKLVRVAREAA